MVLRHSTPTPLSVVQWRGQQRLCRWQGLLLNDGSLEAAQARALSRATKNNFQESDAYEKMQFYYHPDHLGSSSYITNLNGEVVQHIEYVPFGEVFVEERNNISNNPLRREKNGKR